MLNKLQQPHQMQYDVKKEYLTSSDFRDVMQSVCHCSCHFTVEMTKFCSRMRCDDVFQRLSSIMPSRPRNAQHYTNKGCDKSGAVCSLLSPTGLQWSVWRRDGSIMRLSSFTELYAQLQPQPSAAELLQHDGDKPQHLTNSHVPYFIQISLRRQFEFKSWF